MAQDRLWLWLGCGFAVVLTGFALALWAMYGPLVFVNALTSVWTCF